jgi:CheY-specific phosphatase CheX
MNFLFDITRKIFEEAAFALVDPPESVDDINVKAAPYKAAALGFHGPFSGKIVILTTERLALTVAANMLGLEEDDPDVSGKAGDALREILNMICGNLLPAIAGSEQEFTIGAPEEISASDFEAVAETGNSEIEKATLYIEGDAVNLILITDKPA